MTPDEREDLEAEDAAQASVPAQDEWQTQPDEDERRMSDEERAALLREQLKALRVIDVAHDMMLSLVTLGYQKLGLTDETEELRNLEDARLAIELLRGVIDVLGVATSEQLVAPFRSTLASMQLNFARVAAPPEVAEEASAAEPSESTPAGESDEPRQGAEGSAEGEEGAGSSADAGGADEPDASDQGA
jgi:hypothetical protein